MKSTQQNKLQSDNISEEINKMFLELQIHEKSNKIFNQIKNFKL